MTDTNQCSFAVSSTTDSVLAIGSGGYSTTVANLAANDPMFWLDSDTNGNVHLCTTKTLALGLRGTFSNSGGTYSLQAINFEVVELVGGRPTSRPHAY